MSAERCPRCALPVEGGCLCPLIPRLRVPYRFVFLRHASEYHRMTNSGRWAAAALEGSVLHDHARGRPPGDAEVTALVGREPAVLLYPSHHPPEVPEPRPRTIVVPDATWSQSRRMVQRLEAIRTLPRLALPAPPDPGPRLRQPTIPGGASTIEAVAGALDLLGEPEAAVALRRLHREAVSRIMALKGMATP